MARAWKSRRSNPPHCHRLQYETQSEGHRYRPIAGKNTTDALKRAPEDTADVVEVDIFAPFPGAAKRSTRINAKCVPRAGLIRCNSPEVRFCSVRVCPHSEQPTQPTGVGVLSGRIRIAVCCLRKHHGFTYSIMPDFQGFSIRARAVHSCRNQSRWATGR
jgi:hypothetical protein